MERKNLSVITMGCSKNLWDSETLISSIDNQQYNIKHDELFAYTDVAIINTCGFIKDAKEESIEMIFDLLNSKNNGDIGEVYVMGCLSERYKQQLIKDIPEVDKFFGVNDINRIAEELNLDSCLTIESGKKIITGLQHSAYVKISEGCNRKCSFCAIPIIRGKHVSRKIEDIVSEVKYISKEGVKEINLIAQDLSYYGLDIYKENSLNRLLRSLVEINGIDWIRMHYAYPLNFPYEVLDTIKQNDKICNYLDIPFQHISDSVLSKMRRGNSKSSTYELISTIRDKVPGIAIRTTLMVGHPGEGNKEFMELLDFVKKMRFERAGVFDYSEEEDTYGANNYKDEISEQTKNDRKSELMNIQEKISGELNEEKIGKVFKVLIDREEAGKFVGRTEYDSPDIDNEVIVEANQNIEIGEFYDVKITSSDSFDLFGENV